jgi:ankyrin repeat protein
VAQPAKKPGASDDSGRKRSNADLLQAAYRGDLAAARAAIADGADVNVVHEQTGMSALHLAIGANNLALTRYLIGEAKASIVPDRSGRWPTLIAAQCSVSEELADYIVEEEANNTALR